MGNCIGLEPNARYRDSVEVVTLQSPVAGKQRKSNKSNNNGDSFRDVLFFPDPGMPCKNFRSAKGCTRKNCKSIHDEGSSLLTFLDYLNGTNHTMEICVFTITCDEVRLAKCARVAGGAGASHGLTDCLVGLLNDRSPTQCSQRMRAASACASSQTTTKPKDAAQTSRSLSMRCVSVVVTAFTTCDSRACV